jgi:hypothetical protein
MLLFLLLQKRVVCTTFDIFVDPSNWLPVFREAELVPANISIQQRTTWLVDVSPYICMCNAKDKDQTRKCRI